MLPLVAMAVWCLLRVAASSSCEEARLKCAYRTGCGMALQNYIMGCNSVLHGEPTSTCPESCQHALIALTSTEEGQELMTVSRPFVMHITSFQLTQPSFPLSFFLLFLTTSLLSPFLTCCAILPISFGGKGPHLRR